MSHIIVAVLCTAVFVLVVWIAVLDFMDSTGWRPGLDWWTICASLLAIGGFGGLAYLLWRNG